MSGLFSKIKTDKTDLFLVLVTFSIFIFLTYSPIKPKKFGDDNFHKETKNWVQILFTDSDWSDFYIEKAPGPDLYYLIPYSLVGVSDNEHHYWLAGIIWNAIFMALAVLLVKKTATELYEKKAGIFSGILMLVFPIHCYYAMGINGESMVYFSFILLLYGGIKWGRNNDKIFNSTAWWLFVLGSLSLVLARLNFVVIVPVIILFLLITIKAKNMVQLRKGLLIYCVLISVFVVIMRVSLDNLPGNKGKDFHDNYGAYVMHLGRFQFRQEPWDWRFWEGDLRGDSKDYIHWQESRKALSREIEAQGKPFHEVYNNWVINDYLSHPFITIRQVLVKAIYGNVFIVNSFRPDNFSLGPLKNKAGYFIFHFLVNSINLFIIIGFLGFLWKNKNGLLNTYWLIALLFISFVGFYAMTYMEPRYLFPVRVLYIITASQFWLGLFHKRIKSGLTKWI